MKGERERRDRNFEDAYRKSSSCSLCFVNSVGRGGECVYPRMASACATRSVLKGGVLPANAARLGMKAERRGTKSWGANFFSRSVKLSVGADFLCGRRGSYVAGAVGVDGQSNQAGGGFALAEEQPVKSFQWPDSKVGGGAVE